MCTICRKFRKGSITAEEARYELEEQIEYLTEDHVEEIEEMLLEEQDTLDYINYNRFHHYKKNIRPIEDDDGYLVEEELPSLDEKYDLGDKED
jgi:hypothetical protein